MKLDSIEFLQHSYNKEFSRSIKERLEISIQTCSAFRGAVAFWTMELHGLKNLLNTDDSFICVDIHQPTNIDGLAQFVENGATNVYLFLYRKSKKGGDYKTPLLHAKLFLFDFNDGHAEIWIGSQNMTNSAIDGFNLESTIVISINKDDKLYKQVNDYLIFIKECCQDIAKHTKIQEKFNTDDKYINYYKKLQGIPSNSSKQYQVLDVICHDIDEIKLLSEKEGYILISAFDDTEWSNTEKTPHLLNSFPFGDGDKILIRALDKRKQLICYNAIVKSSRQIRPENEGEGTVYTDNHGKKHQVNGVIIQPSEKLILVFSHKFIDINEHSVFVIISLGKEFEKRLSKPKKENFWMDSNKSVSNLLYLKTLGFNLNSNEKVEIEIPKSLENNDTEDTSNGDYPLDKLCKIGDISQLAQEIDAIYQELMNTKKMTQHFVLTPSTKKCPVKNRRRITGRIIRRLVISD